jgi:hypothetical protein
MAGDLGVRLDYHHDSGELDAEVNTAEACAKRGVRRATWYIAQRVYLRRN